MSARRSVAGVGKISLIYTVGERDPHADPIDAVDQDGRPILTASVGEDFADCSWPVTVKAKPEITREELREYLVELAHAVDQGFFMNPAYGAALYWRWTGAVPPGLFPEDDAPLEEVPNTDQTRGTGRRTMMGEGQTVAIYLLDDADRWQGDHFYGKIQGETALSGSVDEDFAASSWPVVVKAHCDVSRSRLTRYVNDLAASVEQGFFFDLKTHAGVC